MDSLSQVFNTEPFYCAEEPATEDLQPLSDAIRKCQSIHGKLGGRAAYDNMSNEQQKEWHSKGGLVASSGAGNRLYGKGTMREQGALNIKNARLNSRKYACPYGCVTQRGNTLMDGGNFKLHMQKIHGSKVES